MHRSLSILAATVVALPRKSPHKASRPAARVLGRGHLHCSLVARVASRTDVVLRRGSDRFRRFDHGRPLHVSLGRDPDNGWARHRTPTPARSVSCTRASARFPTIQPRSISTAEGKPRRSNVHGSRQLPVDARELPRAGRQWIPLLPRSDGPAAGVRRRSARDQHDRTRAHGPCRDTGSARVRAAVDRNRSPLEAPRRVRRHRLHEVLRVVPRPSRRANSDARRAGRDVAGAHSAHARLRADDEHRVSDEARRARSRRGISRQRKRRCAAAERIVRAGQTHHGRRAASRAGPAGDRRKTTRAIKLPSARDSAPPTSRGSSSNGRMVLPATSSRSRRPPS